MLLRIGRFFCLEILSQQHIFVRVPFIGQVFIGGGLTTFDTWGTLRGTGEV